MNDENRYPWLEYEDESDFTTGTLPPTASPTAQLVQLAKPVKVVPTLAGAAVGFFIAGPIGAVVGGLFTGWLSKR